MCQCLSCEGKCLVKCTAVTHLNIRWTSGGVTWSWTMSYCSKAVEKLMLGSLVTFLRFRKPPHSYKEVSSPTLQFFPECATLSDIWIGHCIWHVSQAFPHVSALRSDSLAMRVMKLTILFKSVTTVVYVYVLVCGGALFKIELLSSQNFIQYHFPLQVWVRLWSDLAGWCWLFWGWIMPSLLLKQRNWVSQL